MFYTARQSSQHCYIEGCVIIKEPRGLVGRRSTHPRTTAALAPNRSCGPCTVCCRVLEIEALDKPAGLLCRHNTGSACGIYRERPDVCARWYCAWRKIGALPDELRPDLSGVVFSLENRPPVADTPEEVCVVGRAVDGAQAFERWEVAEAFAMFVREGSLPVWKVADRHATLIYPGPQNLHGGAEAERHR